MGETTCADYKPVINTPEAIEAIKMYIALQKFAPPGITNFNWEQVLLQLLLINQCFLIPQASYHPFFKRS